MRLVKYTAPLWLLLLGACSGGEPPRVAVMVAPVQASADFGNLRVRHNALPTLSLSEAVAREYGVSRDAGTGLVLVAIREVTGDDEIGVEGKVSGVAYDLRGKRQDLAFSTVQVGEYSDHLANFAISERDTYRFEITVVAAGRTETVKFQQNF